MERRPLYTSLDVPQARMTYTARPNLETPGLIERKWIVEKEQAYKEEVVQHSGNPANSHINSLNISRQRPIKGYTFDSGLMRERDNKFTSNLPGKYIYVRDLPVNANTPSIAYQQDETVYLQQEVAVNSPLNLKPMEMEREEANLRHVISERDSLKEQLRILQERALSERDYLIQRVEDLQATILTLDQQRSESNSKQSTMEEDMLGLEGEVHTLGCKLKSTEEELTKTKSEYISLRQHMTKVETAFTDRQRNMVTKIRELQNVEERNKQLDEKNDSLLKQVNSLTEEACTLQSTVSQLNQDKDALQKHLEDKDKTVGILKLKAEKLETSAGSLQEVVRGKDQELEALQRNLADTEAELDAVLREKEEASAQLRANLDKACMDNQTLLRKVEGYNQEMKVLQGKLQDYVTETSCTNELLSSNEEVIEQLQNTVEELEMSAGSLQQAVRGRDQELEAIKKNMASTEAELMGVMREKKVMVDTNAQLRAELDKTYFDIQALQRKLQESGQEAEALQNKFQDYDVDMSCMMDELSMKENVIGRLQLTVEELERSLENLQVALSRGDQELEAVRRKLAETEESLSSARREKEIMLQTNTHLRINLDKAYLDNQGLQRKVDNSSQEVEVLQSKLNNYDMDMSNMEEQLSSKEKVIGSLQLTLKELETSAESRQEAVNRGSMELDALRRKLFDTEESLDTVIRERDAVLEENTDLRDDLEKVKFENQALLIKLDGSNQEMEIFRKKLREYFTHSSNTKKLLNSKEKIIGRLQLAVDELESSSKSLQQIVRGRDQELEVVKKKLTAAEKNLDTVMKDKEMVLQGNATYRDVKVQSDNQALQSKVEGYNQEMGDLQRKLQNLNTGFSGFETWVSTKERTIRRPQLTTAGLATAANNMRKVVRGWDQPMDTVWTKPIETEAHSGASVREQQTKLTQLLDLRHVCY